MKKSSCDRLLSGLHSPRSGACHLGPHDCKALPGVKSVSPKYFCRAHEKYPSNSRPQAAGPWLEWPGRFAFCKQQNHLCAEEIWGHQLPLLCPDRKIQVGKTSTPQGLIISAKHPSCKIKTWETTCTQKLTLMKKCGTLVESLSGCVCLLIYKNIQIIFQCVKLYDFMVVFKMDVWGKS